MTVDPNLLFAQGSLSLPFDDVSTSGGIINVIGVIGGTYFGMTQPVTPTLVEVVSDNAADTTQQITVIGRDVPGDQINEAVTLNGTTPVVLGTTVYAYIQLLNIDASYTGTITLQVSVAGADIAILENFPQMAQRVTMYKSSFSDSISTLVRFEKMFWRNANVEALDTPFITLVADPSARIEQGIATSKGDSQSVANRLTTPPGVTFVDDNVAQAVPTGTLASGEDIGCWYEQTLPAGAAATVSTFTSQLDGQDLP